jgi:predicted porin
VRVTVEEGESEVDLDQGQLGLRGNLALSPDLGLLVQCEASLRLEADPVLDARLGLAGLQTEYGRIAFGKQWASYYEVAVFTDQMPGLGGRASGAFNVDDGSLSGTGRPSHALQYRHAASGLRWSLQAQIRDLRPGSPAFADTLGGSLVLEHGSGLDLGAALSVVRDGVEEPGQDQARSDDRAIVVGARYEKGGVYLAAVHAWLRNHERDDQGRYFSGRGFEAYASYDLTKALELRAEFDSLEPSDDTAGQYRIRSGILGLRWKLPLRLAAHAVYRIEGSRSSDGSARPDTLLGQLHFDF